MSKKPHILIFNPDQWRGDVMGHLGNPAAVTPNLDAIVENEAVSFSTAFCQNPVCTPSRCSFMTGWYPHTRGHRTMFHMLRKEEPCLLQILKDDGYFVWWGGKNDLTPAQDGYDKYCDIKYQAETDDFKRWGHTPKSGLHGVSEWRGAPDSDTFYSFYAGKLDTGDDDIYCDGDWANVFGTIDFIRNAPKDQPLCMYLPLQYPHPPYGVEDPWFSMIDREKLPTRMPVPENWDGKPALLKGIWERQNMQGWTEERWTELRATYYGMCARVDYQFGLIIDALRKAGLYDDTAIFFFPDHGDFTGDYGLVEKTQNTFEDVLSRVPFIIKPPKEIPIQPRVSNALVELVDFPATVFDLTGITPEYTQFGRSLLPVVSGNTDEHRDAVFCEGGRIDSEDHCKEAYNIENKMGHYWPRVSLQWESYIAHSKAVMCRTSRYKYVNRLYEMDEFYDLYIDPCEMKNLINNPLYNGEIIRHKERMLKFFMETGDVVPYDLDRRW
ncbi:MAG: sulfatase-like hydrolase/transferase [bacterium]